MKRFIRRITKKTKIKLSPKEADEIIRQEFTTEKGNKMQKRFIFQPHSPNDATIKFDVKGKREVAE